MYQFALMTPILLFLWYPHRKHTTPFEWRWGILLISVFLAIADWIYFYTLSFPDSMISIVSMIRRSSVLVIFAAGALLLSNPETDVTIYGHTDNKGTRAVNQRISKERATAVANYLVGQGVQRNRLTIEGLAFDQPVASNETADGRAQNRRVEIYITARC